jgi:diaminopimelate epimerase
MLLGKAEGFDFSMTYYNADGLEGSMCGNGGRCIVAFAKKLHLISNETTFIATDGLHKAIVLDDGIVSLQMKDVEEVRVEHNYVFLNTGSPHHVTLVEE